MGTVNYNRELPVYGEFDVVVCGGGTAGTLAAIAAAKQGAKTLLLERSCGLGGCMTQGLVQSLHGYRLHQGYKGTLPTSDWSMEMIVKNRVCMELFERLQKAGGTAFADSHPGDPSLRENIDEEPMMRVLEEMTEEYGVRVLFDSFVFDAVMEENVIKGVVFSNKSGAQIALGKVIVDCTADSDVCYKAGCDYVVGDSDGRCSGISMFMEIGGIDFDRFAEYLKNRPEPTAEEKEFLKQEKFRLTNGGGPSPKTKLTVDGAKRDDWKMEGKKMTIEDQIALTKEGKFPNFGDPVEAEWYQYLNDHPETPFMPNTTAPKPMYPRSPRFVWYGLVRCGQVRYDQTMGGVSEVFTNCINGEEFTDAMLFCRKINWIQLDFLRERIPGFENAYCIKMSPLCGTRESRRIKCDYFLNLDDLQEGHWFPDTVVFGGFNNIHLKTGQFGSQMFIEPNRKFAVPYRCIVPQKVENLLMAGRSYWKHELIRNSGMPTMMALGEAAGTAAAVAVKNGVSVRDVNVRSVQEIMGLDLEELDADLAKNAQNL